MNKAIIYFEANEQCLKRTGTECFASDTVSYIEADFNLGENWSGFDSVRAVWSNGWETVSTVLDSDGKAIVPTEVLTRRAKVRVNLVGSIANGNELTDRLTTFPIDALDITKKALIDGSETTPITPSQFEQFVANVKADADRAENARDDAETIKTDVEGLKADVVQLKSDTEQIKTDTESLVNGFDAKVTEALDDISEAKTDALDGISSAKTQAVDDVTAEANTQKSAITQLGTTQKDAIIDEGTRQIGLVTEEGTDQVEAVQNEGQTQVNTVRTEGGTQITNIEQRGADVLSRIPYFAPIIVDTAEGSIASFSDGADDYPMKSVVAEIVPIQEGTGDPSPTNVRPISGWDSIKAYISGKNLSSINVISQVSWATLNNIFKDIINSLKEGIYKISFKVTVDSASKTGAWNYGLVLQNMSFYHYDKSGGTDPKVGDVRYFSETLIVDANNRGKCTNAYFYGCGSNAQGIMGTATISELQIEFRTKTDYEPYQGQTITKSLGRTVYGGTLDLIRGVLTVDRAMVDLGTLNWIYVSSVERPYFRTPNEIVEIKPSAGNSILPLIICSVYTTETWSHVLDNDNYDKHVCIGWQTHSYVAIRDTSYTDATSFKTAMNGVQLVYELATPQTYQLTPEQIETLLGVNNIWADTGDISVEYPADTKLYIDKKINAMI